jgi:tetratricopeptide (TPR) repeat protein
MRNLNHMLSMLMIPSAGATQNAGYWLEKGNELCNGGQPDEAIKAYEHALSIDKTLIDAWNNKGLVLASQNRFDEALQSFNEALKLAGQHKQALSNKGMVLAQQKKYPEALSCFEAAIAADPYFAGAWYNMALAMHCLGREKEAVAAMKTAKTLEGEGGGCCRR